MAAISVHEKYTMSVEELVLAPLWAKDVENRCDVIGRSALKELYALRCFEHTEPTRGLGSPCSVLYKPRRKHRTEDGNVEDGHAASSGTLVCDPNQPWVLSVSMAPLSNWTGWKPSIGSRSLAAPCTTIRANHCHDR